jgi:hypothetical protein
MPLSAVFLALVMVLVKSALIAGGTFYVTFVLCYLFPTASRFLVRLLGAGK